MNDDDLENLLSGAFEAQARAGVPDSAVPPPPRFAEPEPVTVLSTHRRRRLLAPLAAAAAVIAAVSLGAVALNHDGSRSTASGHRTSTTSQTTSAQSPGDVHVRLLNQDGLTYGVGMPVIAYFSQKITDGRAFQRATTATVNGKSTQAAWYFEPSSADPAYPIEAHLRPRTYWPAHAKIHVAIATKGLSGGGDLRFDDSLTLDFRTGAAQMAVVANHELTLTTDGKPDGTYPVSLGAQNMPTRAGTKVIMEKSPSICIHSTDFTGCGVKYAQRLTYGGEYLLGAPWNVKDIDAHVDTSAGSTTLLPADAKTLYAKLEVGDVVRYPTAKGNPMTIGSGYGDWNVSWKEWLTGGLVSTR